MKAAFTRAYNKEVHLTPYSLLAVKKSRRGGGGESEVGGEDMDNQTQESEDEGESLQTDAMIKVSTIRSGVPASFRCSLFVTSGFILSCSRRRPRLPGKQRRRKMLGNAKARLKPRPRSEQ